MNKLQDIEETKCKLSKRFPHAFDISFSYDSVAQQLLINIARKGIVELKAHIMLDSPETLHIDILKILDGSHSKRQGVAQRGQGIGSHTVARLLWWAKKDAGLKYVEMECESNGCIFWTKHGFKLKDRFHFTWYASAKPAVDMLTQFLGSRRQKIFSSIFSAAENGCVRDLATLKWQPQQLKKFNHNFASALFYKAQLFDAWLDLGDDIWFGQVARSLTARPAPGVLRSSRLPEPITLLHAQKAAALVLP